MTTRAPRIGDQDDAPKIIEPEEVEALLDACKLGRQVDLRNRAAFEAMYRAGLRVSEVADLRLEDVQIDGDWPHLHVRNGKGGKARNVPVGEKLAAWLARWRDARPAAANGIFFTTREGGAVSANYLRQAMKRLAREAGLPEWLHPHTLRHCYATERLEANYTLREVQALLGHSSMASTQVYLHVRDQQLAERVAGDPEL